jgi:hypothetical protein
MTLGLTAAGWRAGARPALAAPVQDPDFVEPF